MYRLKSCVDFKPYEGEKSFIKFEKRGGYVSSSTLLSIAIKKVSAFKWMLSGELKLYLKEKL